MTFIRDFAERSGRSAFAAFLAVFGGVTVLDVVGAVDDPSALKSLGIAGLAAAVDAVVSLGATAFGVRSSASLDKGNVGVPERVTR